MRSKISLKHSLLIAGIIGSFLLLVIIFFLTSSELVESIQGISLGQSNSSLPVRLNIPTIKVDASFEYVGVTPQGAMGAPKGPTNVAWFNLGPRPGEKGSAVIAGHEGWKNGIPAVFDNLYKLKKGDKIYVKDKKGVTITFVVRELRTYDLKEDASAVFRSSDGKAHLNLVTCKGVWNKITKSYSNRLVVFTDRVE